MIGADVQYRSDTEDGSGPRLSDDGLPCAFCRVTAVGGSLATVRSVPPLEPPGGVGVER
jgi:hypothetical protein